jgi:hypothetical protein
MKRKSLGRLMGVAIAASSILGTMAARACTSIVVSRGLRKIIEDANRMSSRPGEIRAQV